MMKEYTITANLVFQTTIATEANSKEEAIEEIKEFLNDHKVQFDNELFDFDDIEVLRIEESK
jgi:wyosine [tRNA(Phe)-imidazoG37] synthetase (radical SAM superfamily)